MTATANARMLPEGTMKFGHAIDLYIADMRAEGRITSGASERSYRDTLSLHADDVANRDPRWTNRDDVKRTLSRWTNPNTRRTRHAHMASFYRWTMSELEPPRGTNPADQVRATRKQPSKRYRLTERETRALLLAAQTQREQRVAWLGVCAGLRRSELLGLQGKHFKREGWVWVSADIGKGGRERWVPVVADLLPLVENIRATVAADEYVIPAERWRNPGVNTSKIELRKRPASPQVLKTVMETLAERAGIHAHITPHTMRHACADHITRQVDIRTAQALLGHAHVGTTEGYLSTPTLDEIAARTSGVAFLSAPVEQIRAAIPLEAPTGIEPVQSASRPVEPNPDDRGAPG